jgi:pilus assembly protein CpaE
MVQDSVTGRIFQLFTVYVAAAEDIQRDVLTLATSVSGATVLGASSSLREALADAAVANPGVLVLDDAVLAENLGLVPTLQAVSYPVVLVTRNHDPAVSRRALTIRARDLVPVGELGQQLPSSLLRHAAMGEESAHAGRVITVFSSKGGVGKTTLAVNLATVLGILSRRPVALVDLDLQFGDVAALLGEMPRATIHDLTGVQTIDQFSLSRALTTTAEGHVHMLAAPLSPPEAEDVRADLVVKVLELLKETHGYVVVDTSPGFSEVNVGAMDFSDDIFMLLTPDVITVRTVKQSLELFWSGFRYPARKVRLIMNRGGSQTGLEPGDLASVLHAEIDYVLPSDGNWPVKAANQGQALMLYQPESGLAVAIRELAKNVMEETEGRRRTGRGERKQLRSSIFGRMLRRG